MQRIVNATGVVFNQYDYDAFGNIRWENSYETVPNRYTFQGREWDAHAAHYHYRFRTYVPEWGGFTGPDMNLSLGVTGEPNGLGGYLFCNNNPAVWTDPEGMSWLSWAFGFGRRGPEAKAFDNYLYEDFMSGAMGARGVAAVKAEAKIAQGAAEAVWGCKLAVGSAGLAAGGGYALVMGGSSRIAGGGGDYVNIFRDEALPDYDAVGVGFTQALGDRCGPLVRDTCAAVVWAGSMTSMMQQQEAALAAEATAIGRSVPTRTAPRLDSATPSTANSVSVAAKSATALTQSEASAVSKINNILNKGIKPGPKGDIAGGVADMMGSPIPKSGGGYWDHAQDLGGMLRGLRNNVAKLSGATDPAAVAVRQQAEQMIKQIEAAIQGAGI